MDQTWAVEYPRPPSVVGSNKKGEAILTNCDSPSRKSKMKVKAIPMPGFLKKEMKTSIKLFGLSRVMAEEDSNFGVTKKFDMVSKSIKKAAQIIVYDQALVLSP